MLFSFISSFLAALISAYLLIRLAQPFGLIAEPGEHRKHTQPTPLVGGIAILFGLLVGILLFASQWLLLLPSLVLLCIVGVLDDRFKLPSWTRFVAQAIAVLLMINLTGVQLTGLGALVSANEVILNRWSVPLTIFACIGVINAVNMSDGMDGLVGSLLILVLLALLFSTQASASLIIIAIASIAGFLVWNIRLFKSKAMLFMGDAGSTVLGLLMAFLLVKSTQAPLMEMPPVTALWYLALPLFDAVTVLILRPLRGQSPFSADRIHYHHLFTRVGLSVNQALLCILLIQAFFIGVGYFMNANGIAQHYQFYGFLVCFTLYFLFVMRRTNN